MFTGIKNLFGSEKGIAGGVLVVIATIFVVTGRMSVTDWQAYTQVIFYGYVGGKVVQGGISTWAGTKKVESLATMASGSGSGTTVSATTAEPETKIETKPEEKTP